MKLIRILCKFYSYKQYYFCACTQRYDTFIDGEAVDE